MISDDTVYLLKECDAGAKMAVSSIDDVLEHVSKSELKELLSECKAAHEKLGNTIHSLLESKGYEDKEPSAMAKGMSWIKTNVKLTINESDATIADLITEGCNMGVKSLNRYLNQYKNADNNSKDICKRLIDLEDQLRHNLQRYL